MRFTDLYKILNWKKIYIFIYICPLIALNQRESDSGICNIIIKSAQ